MPSVVHHFSSYFCLFVLWLSWSVMIQIFIVSSLDDSKIFSCFHSCRLFLDSLTFFFHHALISYPGLFMFSFQSKLTVGLSVLGCVLFHSFKIHWKSFYYFVHCQVNRALAMHSVCKQFNNFGQSCWLANWIAWFSRCTGHTQVLYE